jgi:RHS repeat-associated protein
VGKKSAWLNPALAGGKAIGTGMMLKVQAGDTVDMQAYARYNAATDNTSLVTGLANLVAGAFGYTGAAETQGILDLFNGALGAGALFGAEDDTRPKAYLNYLFFDEDLSFDDDFGYDAVSSAALNNWEKLSLTTVAQKPGYMYIYVANESMAYVDVYFDDLTIKLTEGPATQLADYYPFGLKMEARSYAREHYRFGYQGQFAEMDEETGWNAFELRMYDAVVGRWGATDPYNEFASAYLAMANNPTYVVDRNGGCTGNDPDCVDKGAWNNGMIYNAQLDAYVLGSVAIGSPRALVTSTPPSWMLTRIDVEFHADVYIKGSAGLLSSADMGPFGGSRDYIAAEIFKIGMRHDFVNGNSSGGVYGDYILEDGIVKFTNGIRVEAGVDYKQSVDVILNLNRREVYVDKFTVGGGAPFVEVKTVHRHSGVHSFDVGLQEEAGFGTGGVIKANINATFQINLSNPHWK